MYKSESPSISLLDDKQNTAKIVPGIGILRPVLSSKVDMHGAKKDNQFTYDYVKLKIGYFSNKIPVWEGIFTLENLTYFF